MAFDEDNFALVSGGFGADAPQLFSYKSSADSMATIEASAYFNNVANLLTINDMFVISGSDGYDIQRVSAVSPNVTVAGFISANDIADGSITAAKLATDAVETLKIKDANVTLAKLAAGITPSHVVKFGAQFTTVGGAAAEAITVTGALATDIAFVQLKTPGAAPRTVDSVAVTADTLTVTFSGDPSNDHVIYYEILRAAA